jgi:peptidyl-Lys metalloendopeptidase
MFSSSLHAIVFILALGSLGVSAERAISVTVTGPDSVTDVENLTIVATVSNTGDQTVKLLNDPQSLLSNAPTDTFSISDASGTRPAFTGIKVKYVPTVARAVTVLEPGQSVQVEHDISQAYNFTSSGEGQYSFQANNLFYQVTDDGTIATIIANEEGTTTSLSGNLGITRRSLDKRETYVGCSDSMQSDIQAGSTAAKQYASNALSYLYWNLRRHRTAPPRFTTWFGSLTSTRRDIVTSHFSNILYNDFSTYTYDCTCTEEYYAYVYPDDFGHVYLCNLFWGAPTTGTDSKAGTLIHETSHFIENGGTLDYAYGQEACMALAQSDPDAAVMNADSHEYFAENTPWLS